MEVNRGTLETLGRFLRRGLHIGASTVAVAVCDEDCVVMTGDVDSCHGSPVAGILIAVGSP